MKLLIKRILSYIPSNLPLGVAEFEAWSSSIIELLGPGLESVPKDDMQFVLASAIQHLGQTQSSVPKNHFVRLVRKAAASQVAGQVFVNIKEKQKAAQEAKLAEATANKEQSNGETKETVNP